MLEQTRTLRRGSPFAMVQLLDTTALPSMRVSMTFASGRTSR